MKCWEASCEILKAEQLSWIQVLMPSLVGVHPENRGGAGLVGSEAHSLGKDQCAAGYSYQRASKDAAVVEVPPAPYNEAAIAKNELAVKLDGGKWIPPLQQLLWLSIGSGHSNAWLRAVLAGLPTPHPEMQDKSGNLNADILSANRPGLKKALTEGLTFMCFSWFVPFAFPRFVSIGQAALNTTPTNPPSELEVALTITNAAQRYEKTPNWDACLAEGVRTQPPCSVYKDKILAFAKGLGGGKGAPLLHEIAEYKQCFASTGGRILGGEFMGKIATMTFGKLALNPYLRVACVELQLGCPPHKMDSTGKCSLLTSAHLKVIAEHKEATKAERILCAARDVLKEHANKMTPEGIVEIRGNLDTRVAAFLAKAGKLTVEGLEFPSLEKIGSVTHIVFMFTTATN